MQTPALIPIGNAIPVFMAANPPVAHTADEIDIGTKAGKRTLTPRTDRIPLLVIEDHASLVSGMRAELAKEYAATYVGTKEEVLAALQEQSFALAVVDLTLHQKLEGFDLMPLLKEAGIKFLVFSGTAEDWHILAAIRFGARGYVNKRKRLHVLSKALALIASGEIAFPPEIMGKMRKRKTHKIPKLGPAEKKALDIFTTMIDPGTKGIPGNQFISEQMELTLNRVERIFRNLYIKFNVEESERVLLHDELQALGYYPGVPSPPFCELGINL